MWFKFLCDYDDDMPISAIIAKKACLSHIIMNPPLSVSLAKSELELHAFNTDCDYGSDTDSDVIIFDGTLLWRHVATKRNAM